MTELWNQERFNKAMGRLIEKYPQLRIGQILSNIVADETELFYIKDETLLHRIEFAAEHSITLFWERERR